MEARWIVAEPFSGQSSIDWTQICGTPCILELLKRKRFADAGQVDSFLWPRLRSLADPFLLPNMQAAVERILRAIDAREKIVLFGDYDVDGVTSLALLSEVLRAFGSEAALFLPLRIEEGYGLSAESVERCLQQHAPELLIALDCGTSSAAEIAQLNARGVDTIVLDHHEPKAVLPECIAVVNPKADAASNFQYLCSAGVVFKVCHALLKARPLPEFDLREHLDLVALGTVADIVPLQAENRVLVQRGSVQLARSSRPGVRKLLEVAAVSAPVAAEDIGFRLGPRLNAAGRLATAEKALRLLITRDEVEADLLARELDMQNRERQIVEKAIFAAAEEQAREHALRDAAIVVGARDWHPGVLGIVASRLARKYCRPTIVIGFDDRGLGKGSGRSIEGLSLVEALVQCERHLEKFGGHEMAAGLTLREENFAAFADAFRAAAREILTDEQLQPCLRVDHELTFRELNHDLLKWHEMLQPFGSGNPQPTFIAHNVSPAIAPQTVKEKHLALRLRQENYFRRAIFFDGATAPLPEPPWDIAFRISSEVYDGETRLQMQVQAIRSAAPR
ncbi:MAG: single-stranded-DNA-specific exonuclease RecJ [Chthoniobacterales bacterium]